MKLKFYQHLLGKNLIIAILAGFALCGNLKAQTPYPQKCGNDIKKLAEGNPDFMKYYLEFEAKWENYKNNLDLTKFQQTTSGKYIIPVVFHVLHLGGSENITRSQMVTLITSLNTLFAMESPNLALLSTFPAFDTLVPYFNGADSAYIIYGNDTSAMLNRFEFRLATLDPFGNCTDGVNRVYTEKTDLAGNFSKFKQYSDWDRSKYFNIWSITSIYDTDPVNTTLGYAQFPFAFGGQFPVTSTDGIALIHNIVGTSGTAAGSNGATPAHEAGHWLGLRHIWGDEECGSDGIDDTPIHFGPDFCDAVAGNPLNANTIDCPPYLPYTAECYIDTNSTDTILNQQTLIKRDSVGRMWMNIMDYTNDDYQSMFSEMQYAKMNNTMETVNFRSNLSTPSNQLETGTDDAAQASLCHASTKPIADLWSTNNDANFVKIKLLCAGSSITMRDGTYNLSAAGSDPHTRVWDLPGGTPNTSTTTNPVVQYDTPGDYDVTITSTNANGTSTKTRSNYVHVSSLTADESNYVYYDDFEYSTSLYEQGKWININQGWDGNAGWVQETNAGYLSSKCMKMSVTNSNFLEKDFLITPSYDLTTMSSDKLYFKFAGARNTTNPNWTVSDQLRVYVSTNCGATWALRNIRVDGVNKTYLAGDTLYSAGLFTDGFIPTAASQWNEGEVDLAAYTASTNLRIMFEYTSGTAHDPSGFFANYGNDFYIDQINITNSTAIGLDENLYQVDYAIYPNPVTATSQIYFNIPKDSKVTVDVLDIAGRVVKQIYSGDIEMGDQFLELHNSDFSSAGIYLVRLNVDGVVSTKKVIIE